MRTTMLTPDEYRAQVAGSMTEGDFQVQVVTLARSMGWHHYHTYDSRRSEAGWPDMVLVHPQRGALFRELKTQKGRLTRAQEEWLDRLTRAGLDTGVWRPADLFNGVIPAALRGEGQVVPR